MRTILVINSKGGSGKTTLTTNLASYYAASKLRTAIMDYDPQGSSLHWVRNRPGHLARIFGASAAPAKGTAMRSAAAWVPGDVEVLIIDAPAGIKGLLLQDVVRRADFIIIPVAPSPIDIHATADFVKELFLFGGARHTKAKIAVVANRVRSSSPAFGALERFLGSLNLPFLTRVSDSDKYLSAVEQGLGVFEMDESITFLERREMRPIFEWLDGRAAESRPAESKTPESPIPASPKPAIQEKVVAIQDTKRFSALRLFGGRG